MGTSLAHMGIIEESAEEAVTGIQKAAILCMVLGAEPATKITQHLSPDELEAISYEIARTDAVPAERVEQVLTEWMESMLGAGSLAAGGMSYAREILEQALGPAKAAAVLKRISDQLSDTAGLYRLRNADPQQLSSTLRNEHPQTVALILAHLEPAHTAAVIKELDPAVGSEVVFRMARMEKVSPEMLQLIERTLTSEADLASSRGMSVSGGPAAAAAVLNLLNASLEKELLDGVAQRDPALSEQIKSLMFVFEDLQKLDARALQRLLREVETKELALALKLASEDLRLKIKGAMSQRAVAALTEEIDLLGPVRMRDVEDAQTQIIRKLRALEESGEIVLNGGADDVVIG
jgi:flagellar motor switch protein FliG